MNADIYVSRQGDMVDEIAWRFYGRTSGGIVEWLLEINHGLADQGAVLPAGVRIKLPPLSAREQDWEGSLWD